MISHHGKIPNHVGPPQSRGLWAVPQWLRSLFCVNVECRELRPWHLDWLTFLPDSLRRTRSTNLTSAPRMKTLLAGLAFGEAPRWHGMEGLTRDMPVNSEELSH